MKVLIIEDEYNLADAIKSMLSKEKYSVNICTDGEEGLDEALTNVYDLIILDVMLPSMDGFEILSEIRKEDISSKVIMLTARSTIEDKLHGLTNGADDYLTKPFHMDELLARVNIQLRKQGVVDNVLTVGDLSLDINSLNLSRNGSDELINVIGKEFQLLEIFMRNPNQVIDRDQLFNKVWGLDSDAESNTLEAYISFLRKKLKLLDSTVSIKAVRNMGYKLEVPSEKTES